jgi:L-lactate dehydrogenase complex protein LldG
MTTSRDRMLARIRQGLESARPLMESVAASAPHAPAPFVHPAEDDLLEQFAAELRKLECYPHLCADDEAALEEIGAILDARGARQVIAWDTQQIGLPGVESLLAQRGIAVHVAQVGGAARAEQLQQLEPATVCISGADAGIAESASIVLRGGPGRPRLASLLAPVYIAVLRRAQIVRGLGEALALLAAQHPGDLFGDASTLTLITGPSRTADIELTLTLGVHGPREVHAIVIG